MSDHDDHHFEAVDAGSSKTFPMQAGSLRKGGHVMLKEKPCKIVDISTSKTGKHGHAKANIVGLDIFTNKKYEDICPTSHNMEVPVVDRTEYTLLNVEEDGTVSLLTDDGSTKDDLDLPKASGDNQEEDISKQIREAFENGSSILVTVLTACGTEKIVSFREMNN